MEYKVKRKCTECGVEYEAASGNVCVDCWPEFQAKSPVWQEFYRWFPWAKGILNDNTT
jgi:hypothetical protein